MKSHTLIIGFFVAILGLHIATGYTHAGEPVAACTEKNLVEENAGLITFEPLVPLEDTFTLNADIVFHKINEYRIKRNLPAFERDENLCRIAKSREGQLWSEITTGKIHAGFKALKLPYFATENMKWGFSEQDVVSWWLSSPIHHKAIVGDYKYSCGTCSGHVCIELFTNYQAKNN